VQGLQRLLDELRALAVLQHELAQLVYHGVAAQVEIESKV
jgi:hypothetical protein